MSRPNEPFEWPVLWIMPPYDSIHENPSGELALTERGGIAVIDIVQPDRVELGKLSRTSARIRLRTNAAIAIRLLEGPSTTALRLAWYAYACGIRALLRHGEPCRDVLWDYLANPLDYPGDFIGWLRLRKSFSADAGRLIARIMTEAVKHDSLEDVLAERISARTLRYRFKREGLPGPNKWFQFGRLLDAQLRLLRDPELTTTQVARDLGYADRLSFTNRIYRVFGVTAEMSRRLLGLEWRFAAWWKRVSHEG